MEDKYSERDYDYLGQVLLLLAAGRLKMSKNWSVKNVVG